MNEFCDSPVLNPKCCQNYSFLPEDKYLAAQAYMRIYVSLFEPNVTATVRVVHTLYTYNAYEYRHALYVVVCLLPWSDEVREYLDDRDPPPSLASILTIAYIP